MTSLLHREVFRRVGTLVLLCAGAALWPHVGWAFGGGLIALSVALYLLIPARPRPPDAKGYERGRAIVGPDLVGFVMTGFFVVLPFWGGASEPGVWDDLWPLPHPSAVMLWPMALISVWIFAFTAHYAAFWILIRPDGLLMADLSGERFIRWEEAREVGRYRRGLPRGVKLLAPLMILRGNFGAAGAVMSARDETGRLLTLKDGGALRLPDDGLEGGPDAILAALKAKGVAFSQDESKTNQGRRA